MIKIIEVKESVLLKDYELYAALYMPTRELYMEAGKLIPAIAKRKVWMINSTSIGGGVAEMMPRTISFLRQLGIDADWIVASTDKKEFFSLTKKIHNLIHGQGNAFFSQEEKDFYEEVNKENAQSFSGLLKPHDIVVIHDPQPMGMAKYLTDKNVSLVWRCHIGIEEHIPQTETAWKFLKPYAGIFNVSVFSATEYIPGYLSGKAVVMHPGIDPLDHKNRELSFHKIIGILSNAGLISNYNPLTPAFAESVKRLQPDGSFQSPLFPSDPGIIFRSAILQVSRWDRLKGFAPLLKGFSELKKNIHKYGGNVSRNLRRIELSNLILAGPDPDFVEDDPEGKEVLNEISELYMKLDTEMQRHILVLKLPMTNRKNNELIVNALQRIATIVVQNSIKEGFGLTVTEALWKSKTVLGTNACGIKQQIRDGIDGRLIKNPENPVEIAEALSCILNSPKERDVWSHSGQKKVVENFLIFTQIRKWINLFADLNR
jgi:trehalose synthase